MKLLLPINPKTKEPNMSQICIFDNSDEANKAKLFLKKTGKLGIVVDAHMLNSFNDFCSLWKSQLKEELLKELGMKDK